MPMYLRFGTETITTSEGFGQQERYAECVCNSSMPTAGSGSMQQSIDPAQGVGWSSCAASRQAEG